MNSIKISLVCIAVWCVAFSGVTRAEEPAIPFQQAVKEGKIEVQVSSLGGATGKTIRVNVRRKVPEQVKIEITPGTMFLSNSETVQNMAGGAVKGEFIGPNTYRPTTTNVFVLADDAWHGYLVESFCMNFHKGPPQRGKSFELAVHDPRAKRILDLDVTKDPKTSVWAVQFALWIDREGISEKELLSQYGRYATEVDVRVAKELVKQAEEKGAAAVPADMPADVRVEVLKLFSPDPTVRAAAVDVLVKMGRKAESAAPFLAENVVTEKPEGVSPSTWLKILTNPEETSVILEQTGLPDLKAIADAIRQRRDARHAEEKKTEAHPGGERPRPLRDKLLKRGNGGEKQ